MLQLDASLCQVSFICRKFDRFFTKVNRKKEKKKKWEKGKTITNKIFYHHKGSSESYTWQPLSVACTFLVL